MNLHSDSAVERAEINKIGEILNKLKKDKKALLIIAVGLIGMLLIVFSGDNDKKEYDNAVTRNDSLFYNADAVKDELTELIEGISGAGETMVMITYKSDEETVFATDTEDTDRNGETKAKKEYVIVKNSSDESGLPLKIIYPEVKGVAVICEGGDNQLVREKIFSLICALFSISSNSVSVASMA